MFIKIYQTKSLHCFIGYKPTFFLQTYLFLKELYKVIEFSKCALIQIINLTDPLMKIELYGQKKETRSPHSCGVH